jgi:DNA-binding transcriptional MerR regulator
MKQLDLFGAETKKTASPANTPLQNVHKPVEDVKNEVLPQIVSSPKKNITKEKNNIEKNGKRGRKSYKEINEELILVELPEEEELFKKQYYSISEVATWFHVNASLLRFWENEFDILKPRKNGKGDRLFRPEDVQNLKVIHYLLRQRKFSIEGAKQYLKENKKKVDQNLQLIQSLTKLRAFLLELKTNLEA